MCELSHQGWLAILPSLLTVIGWFVAFWIAIMQYKKARKQSVNMEVYKNFLEVYTKLATSTANLRDAGWGIRNNMDLVDRLRKEVDDPKRISFDLTHISKLEDSFENMRASLLLLDIWLGAVQKTLPNAKGIQEVRGEFKEELQTLWLDLTIELNIIKIKNEFDTKKFEKPWLLVSEKINAFEQELRSQASESESYLLKG